MKHCDGDFSNQCCHWEWAGDLQLKYWTPKKWSPGTYHTPLLEFTTTLAPRPPGSHFVDTYTILGQQFSARGKRERGNLYFKRYN